MISIQIRKGAFPQNYIKERRAKEDGGKGHAAAVTPKDENEAALKATDTEHNALLWCHWMTPQVGGLKVM